MPKAKVCRHVPTRKIYDHTIKKKDIGACWGMLAAHKFGTLVLPGSLVITADENMNPLQMFKLEDKPQPDEVAITLWTERFLIHIFTE